MLRRAPGFQPRQTELADAKQLRAGTVGYMAYVIIVACLNKDLIRVLARLDDNAGQVLVGISRIHGYQLFRHFSVAVFLFFCFCFQSELEVIVDSEATYAASLKEELSISALTGPNDEPIRMTNKSRNVRVRNIKLFTLSN